jgi:hypothetical protein
MSYLHLKRPHFAWLATLLLLSWLSGIVWIGLRIYNNQSVIEAGFSTSLELLLMKAHSLFSYFLILLVGTMVWHVSEGLKGRKNKLSGVLMILCFLSLVLTGWGLYYVADELARSAVSAAHIIIGATFGGLFLFHQKKIRGRKTKN